MRFRCSRPAKLLLLAAPEARPNPALEPTPTAMALGPLLGLGHHPYSGPSAMPVCEAQRER